MVTILALTVVVSALSCAAEPLREIRPVTLSQSRSVALFPLDRAATASSPTTLELSVTAVQNPRAVSLMLVATLETLPAANLPTPPVTTQIGTATLYPADRPGMFILSSTEAFAFLSKNEEARDRPLRLRVELMPVHAEQKWQDVEVTVGSPVWKTDRKVAKTPDDEA